MIIDPSGETARAELLLLPRTDSFINHEFCTEYRAVISMNMEDQDKLQSHTKQRTKENPLGGVRVWPWGPKYNLSSLHDLQGPKTPLPRVITVHDHKTSSTSSPALVPNPSSFSAKAAPLFPESVGAHPGFKPHSMSPSCSPWLSFFLLHPSRLFPRHGGLRHHGHAALSGEPVIPR